MSTNAEKTVASESKQFIHDCIAAGTYTRKQIVDEYLAKYPDRKKSTVQTYLSDSLNKKYCAFALLATVNKRWDH